MKTIIKFFTINPQSAAVLVLFLLVGFSSCKKNDTTQTISTVNYAGSFVKSSATTVTSATGTVTATFNPTTMVLSYTVVWSGLTSNAANMHFHDAGPVIYPITGFAAATSGTLAGTVTLTASQATDLAAGSIYVQIHTVTIPAGEILAYLLKGTNNYITTGGDGGY
jgi:hypothetical protein